MKAFLTACAGALVFSAAAVSAQPVVAPDQPVALDANNDGAVDQTELDTYGRESFTVMDINDDGYLTEAETRAYIPVETYTAANTNHDSGLSKEEYKAQAQKDFTAADTDKDGKLD